MEKFPHTVTLDLNITGYDGSDLDRVVPHFMTERDTDLVLSWEPTAEGPESFRLIIEIAAGFAAGNFFKTFIQELSKDLYEWSKKKLSSLFERKRQAMGAVRIEFENVTVRYYSNGGKDIEALFQELPNLIELVDHHENDEWRIEFDKSTTRWSIVPSGENGN